jgi:hypothetical protein
MNRYPEDKAVKNWMTDGLTFSIADCRGHHFCGYVRFPARPLKEPGYHGIASYVPVHGGITFAEQDPDGSMVYGFDCAHADDDENPVRRDMGWLMAECERMAEGIIEAAKVEDFYLLAEGDNDKRAAILDGYHAALASKGIAFDLSDNFGSMINALFGRL